MRWLIEKICKYLVKWCEDNDRVFKIMGGPKGKTVYLVRYIVFKSKWGCIYIHRFMRSDADDPHDHPWNFFTYVISGRYKEVYYDMEVAMAKYMGSTSYWQSWRRLREPGSIAYRRAHDIHQVIVDKERTMDEIEDAPFTLCIMGPRLRSWGFWTDKGGTWTDWRKYLDIQHGDPRIEGSE